MAQERELDHGSEVDGELLVLSSDGATTFEPADAAPDGVPPAVEIRIEHSRVALPHVAALARRDDGPDAAVTSLTPLQWPSDRT